MFWIQLLPGAGSHAEPQRGVDDVHVVSVVPVGGAGALVVVPDPGGDLKVDLCRPVATSGILYYCN